jgi:SAM-dependent methyltransferase
MEVDPVAELKSFDRVADVYDETRGLPSDVSGEIADGMAKILRAVAPSPWLLEVGIGTGRMAVPLAEAGIRVTGVDISPKMLAVLAGKRRDIDVMLAEAARLPLRAGSFDGLLFVHILHLVPDAEATIRATLPMVRAGGVAIRGVDDSRGGLVAQADAMIAAAVRDIAGVDLGARDHHADVAGLFEQAMRAAGARIEQVTLARWHSTTRGGRMIERLARRDYSSAWLIPEASLPAIVERVTPQIEELYGGLDREIEHERSFSATVAWLPR